MRNAQVRTQDNKLRINTKLFDLIPDLVRRHQVDQKTSSFALLTIASISSAISSEDSLMLSIKGFGDLWPLTCIQDINK